MKNRNSDQCAYAISIYSTPFLYIPFLKQKFGYITVTVELLFALFTNTFLWLHNILGKSSSVLNCLGDDDIIYFKFDYFTPGGYSRKKKYCQLDNIVGKYICQGSLALLMIIASNLLEIYLTSAVMFEIKKSTKSVTQLLSRKSLADRKRYVLCLFSFVVLLFLNNKNFKNAWFHGRFYLF